MAKTPSYLIHTLGRFHWWHQKALGILLLSIGIGCICLLLPYALKPPLQYAGVLFATQNSVRGIEDSDVHPNGLLIATMTENQVLFGVADHPEHIQEVWPVASATGEIAASSIGWDRSGRILVFSYFDRQKTTRFEVWDYPLRQHIATYYQPGASIRPFAIHPAAPVLAIQTSKAIILWNWNTEEQLLLAAPNTIQQHLAFSIDGRWLVSETYVYDTSQPTHAPQSLRVLGLQGRTIAMHPNKSVVFIGRGGYVLQVNLSTMMIEQQVECFSHPINSLTLSQDGTLLAIGQGWQEFSGDSPPEVQIRRVSDLSLVEVIPAQGRGTVNRLGFIQQNKAILIQARDFNKSHALYNADQAWIVPIK